jgi:hypothetical protein
MTFREMNFAQRAEAKKAVWDEIMSTGGVLIAHKMGEKLIGPNEERAILKRRKVLMKELSELRRLERGK